MNDESYIQLAIEVAKKGAGKVSPNPLVGAVIVKNDKIIGVGYHEYYGGPHAEVNAIKNAKQSVEGATLYVNLEPCSHHGQTPPCVDAIIENKFKRVVIGTLDMNPVVCGNGIKKLKYAGIEVKVGALENECADLNKFFFKWVVKGAPYVSLKAAQTLDGKIADVSGYSKWVSSLPSRRYVHTLRSEYDAVLVGSNTVKCDDPSLTVRLVEGRNPKRIIIDTDLKLSLNHKIFWSNKDKNLILLTCKKSIEKKRKIKELVEKGIDIVYVKKNRNGKLNMADALKELGKKNINSIMVEGGQKVYSSFLKDDLYDDVLLFISPKILGAGISTFEDLKINSIKKALKLKIRHFERAGDDLLIELTK